MARPRASGSGEVVGTLDDDGLHAPFGLFGGAGALLLAGRPVDAFALQRFVLYADSCNHLWADELLYRDGPLISWPL